MDLYTIEEWKERTKNQVKPTGVCECAGCKTKLRARQYNTTWFEHLADVEQPTKYCRTCLKNGHNLVFSAKYENGKRVVFNLKSAKLIQADMH